MGVIDGVIWTQRNTRRPGHQCLQAGLRLWNLPSFRK